MFEHGSLKKRLATTFSAILAAAFVLISVVLISVALFNTGKLRDTVYWNTHTHQVLQESEMTLLNLVNIETGLRGFVASGDEKFLDPCKRGQKDFGIAFDKAKTLTLGSDLLAVRSEALESTVASTTWVLMLGFALTRSVFRQLGAGPSVAFATARAQIAQGSPRATRI